MNLAQLPFYQPSFRELPYAMKRHWAKQLHDDLRLQYKNVLLSWALLGRAIYRVGESRTAIEMEDHSKENILFEGVHKTGTIMVWDCGSWEPLTGNEDVLTCLEKGFLRFALRGGKVQGIWTLTRRSRATSSKRAVWRLRKEADLFDQPRIHECALEVQPISICSQRTKDEIDQDWDKAKETKRTLFS